MSDFGTEILRKYGTTAIVFAVAASLIIWGLAHYAASPGTEVSILWGFVKYTKTGTLKEKPVQELQSTTSIPEKKVIQESQSTNTTPLSLKLKPITIESQKIEKSKDPLKAMYLLRSKYKLRELNTLESGKKISEIPVGTFFFVYGGFIHEYPGDSLSKVVMNIKIDRLRTSSNDFEAYLREDNTLYFVGFFSETDAAQISLLSGDTEHKIVFSPSCWGPMNTLISFPFDRIRFSQARYIQISEDKNQLLLDIVVK